MKKGKALNWDGKSRVSNDVYRERWTEIFGNKKNTPANSEEKEDKVNNVDLKGTVFCKAKKCSNHLYKYESDSLPGYCQECG